MSDGLALWYMIYNYEVVYLHVHIIAPGPKIEPAVPLERRPIPVPEPITGVLYMIHIPKPDQTAF